jgi:hypothetical protein
VITGSLAAAFLLAVMAGCIWLLKRLDRPVLDGTNARMKRALKGQAR